MNAIFTITDGKSTVLCGLLHFSHDADATNVDDGLDQANKESPGLWSPEFPTSYT